jgi:hypothetical protein
MEKSLLFYFLLKMEILHYRLKKINLQLILVLEALMLLLG